MNIDFKVTTNYSKLINTYNDKYFLISEGGARSGKSYAILQYLIKTAEINKNKGLIFSVVAQTHTHVINNIMKDFIDIIVSLGIYNDKFHTKGKPAKYILFGNIFQFFAVDTPTKARGVKSDFLYINEANNVKWLIAQQLITRTKYKVLIDYNPSEEFWAHKEIMQTVEWRDEWAYIHSTYLDNEFFSDEEREKLLKLGSKDPEYNRVFVMGLLGSKSGNIFQNYNIIEKIPDDVIIRKQQYFGIDWGWQNDPSTIIECYIVEETDGTIKDIYVNELYYQIKTHNKIIKDVVESNIKSINYEVIADSAEPKSIAELSEYGINIFPADKPSGSVNYGIEQLQRINIYITENSLNTINEFKYYKWAVDKDGNIRKNSKGQPIPVDTFNHTIDPLRYVVIHFMNKLFNYKDVPKAYYHNDDGWEIF